MSKKIEDMLLPALRQYMHNDGEGFIFGYDIAEVNSLWIEQQAEFMERAKLAIEKKMFQYPNFEASRLKNDHMREAIEALKNEFYDTFTAREK